MKKLIILGSGCSKCNQLTEVVTKASDEIELECEIEKVTDFLRFADFGIMITPALVVDGVVKVSGKVPPIEQMKILLSES